MTCFRINIFLSVETVTENGWISPSIRQKSTQVSFSIRDRDRRRRKRRQMLKVNADEWHSEF